LTASWQGVARQESFDLLSQGAQDIRAYDCIKDISRVERFVYDRPGADGAVIVVTNDPNYWTPPSHGRITNAHQFRIHEGATISGRRSWGPHTGVGTLKSRENPIITPATGATTQLFRAHVVAFAISSSPSTAEASPCTHVSIDRSPGPRSARPPTKGHGLGVQIAGPGALALADRRAFRLTFWTVAKHGQG
jgi:hypothetical protein